MTKTYPALTIFSGSNKAIGSLIIGFGILLAAVSAASNNGVGLILAFATALFGVSFFAIGEFVQLVMQIESNTRNGGCLLGKKHVEEK